MKLLISAEVVRVEHAAGKREIVVSRDTHLITPEARSVASELGVVIRDSNKASSASVQAAPIAPNVSEAAPTSSSAKDDLQSIRAAVLAKLPQDSVDPDLVDQLVSKILQQKTAVSGVDPAKEDDTSQAYESSTISSGIKLVKGHSIKLGIFEGAGKENQVGIADVVTQEDGSSIAAGFMSWNNCFFPWTLTYDEVDLILEGELHIRSEGQTVIAKAGDVVFIPKNSPIEFGTTSSVRFLYVAYPANWSEV